MKKTRKKSVIVVVHDAGGAEIIGAYIRAQGKKTDFIAYGAGPAIKIFRRLKIPLKPIGASSKELTALMKQYRDASYALIAAPGWMTRMEINALEAAKRQGLKAVVYMESWVDERKRFGSPEKGWQRRLPDMFWVGDRYALARIKRQFPHTPVRLVPNKYFKTERARYKLLKDTRRADTILFMSTQGGDSHELLERVLKAAVQKKNPPTVRVRYHPADDRHRYDALIREYRSRVDIEESREKDIVRDLVRARIVVGSETVAMAVSTLCGIKTINLLKPGHRPMLPFEKIVHIKAVGDIARLI